MLRCALLALFAGAAVAVPELTADGNDLVLSVTGDGGVSIQYPLGGRQLIATEQDTADLEDLMKSLLTEQKAENDASLKEMKETFDAKIADLQSALVESNGQKDALQTQVDALQGAVQVTTASLDDAEVCQQGIVDAIHGGSADDIKGCPESNEQGGCDPYQELQNGQAVGHGERKGAVRFIKCDDGYIWSGGANGIVVCDSDGKWSDGGNGQCAATTTTTTTATTTTTTTTIRKEWILIFRQKDCAWSDPDGGDVGKTDSDDCFARFNEMKNHKKDGKFRFKLLYPRDEDANELIFEQDTNPLDVEPGNYVVPGFKIISTGDDDVSKWTYAHRRPPAFSGLLRYVKGDNAVLVASSGYWYALGSPLKCFPGNQFTRDNGFTCTESRGAWNADWAELWIKNEA